MPSLEADHPGLSVTLGSEQEEQGRFGPALAQNFVLALFGGYALLALALRSYARPLILLLVLPFGFGGAVLGHALLGLDLTLPSMFVVIGLVGILINGTPCSS